MGIYSKVEGQRHMNNPAKFSLLLITGIEMGQFLQMTEQYLLFVTEDKHLYTKMRTFELWVLWGLSNE